jgi:predicted DNA-binding ribbon-helix-helix protein
MVKTARAETKAKSVRIPLDVYADLQAVAAARGIDFTALVNSVLADARPELVRWLKQYRADLAAARNGKET